MTSPRAEIVVDLAAIRHNVRTLRRTAGVPVMAVVKADGYGHGMHEVATAARDAGAEWLGVATLDEAVALRVAGDSGRLLCWLTVPGEDYGTALATDIDVTAYSVAELDEIAAAAAALATGTPARVQLKVDTGLSRGGAAERDWEGLFAHALAGEEAGRWRITGLWSHFACSDEPAHPANDAQEAAFERALAAAERAGLRPEVRHLANSAAAILRPSSRFDLVRCGIAIYGLDPAPGHTPDLGLVPAMTARARLAMVKSLEAGDAVSYGQLWTAEQPTTVGLVPAGYGEGVPRAASNVAQVAVGGRRRPLRGRVCMDQFVVDLGGDLPDAGADAVLFGPGGDGEPTAQEWAEACGTISYEIVTRIGGRMARTHVDSEVSS
ncbi:alanine racemase [Nocardioides sp. cx-169]|uniref:alanine racemase n=1 Tax=Nocardioides sp. cx-169 TaxID=2899080 RepID=UPI001E5C50B1|nr:alanine racemase [Nocardioides sp. cx-169]MCD4535702.1 alanine racemase [Nocardioides sp. cx-169]